MSDKQADLAGPGIGDYAELVKILPDDYNTPLTPKETQIAITAVKEYIENNEIDLASETMATHPAGSAPRR